MRSAILIVTFGAACVALGVALGFSMGPRPQAARAVSAPATAAAAPTCEAERAELAATRAQLAICLAHAPEPDSPAPATTGARAPVEEHDADSPMLMRNAEARRQRERLDSLPEAVLVQHRDGRIGIYPPEEWPPAGGEEDGIVLARKPRGGKLGWYHPDAGPRSDPHAFWPAEPIDAGVSRADAVDAVRVLLGAQPRQER